MLTRRGMLLSSGSALVIGPVDEPPQGTRTVFLNEETLVLAREMVAEGYGRTVQEVVAAAIHWMMERDGWRSGGAREDVDGASAKPSTDIATVD